MNFKLIALDLDGTLYNSEKVITKKTYDALIKAQKMGVKVLLSSGRSTSGIRFAAEDINLANYGGYISGFNGGKIIEADTKKVMYENLLKLENTKEIYDLSKKFNTNILAYIGEDVYYEKFDVFTEIEVRLNQVFYHQVDNLLENIVTDIPKFILLESEANLDKVEPTIQEILKDRFTVTRSEPYFLEVMPYGSSKGEALINICKVLDINISQTMAFGDSFNDLSMIKVAGLGVAMGNSKQAIKDAADIVAPTNDEDGIATVLEQYLFS